MNSKERGSRSDKRKKSIHPISRISQPVSATPATPETPGPSINSSGGTTGGSGSLDILGVVKEEQPTAGEEPLVDRSDIYDTYGDYCKPKGTYINTASLNDAMDILMGMSGAKIKLKKKEKKCKCKDNTHTYQLADPKLGHYLPVFKAREECNCVCRCCCGTSRRFTMVITDIDGQEMFRAERGCNCGILCCLSPCCLQCCKCRDEIIVKSIYNGEYWGTVREEWNCVRSLYCVYGPIGQKLFNIQGPSCKRLHCRCVKKKKMTFQIVNSETKERVGMIFQQFPEDDPDPDVFGVEFPEDADEKLKAVFIATTLLINIVHFDKR